MENRFEENRNSDTDPSIENIRLTTSICGIEAENEQTEIDEVQNGRKCSRFQSLR